METVTILWALAAGISITLAAVCGAVWLVIRRDFASLMLCGLGIAAAASAYFEVRLMHASTVAQYNEFFRWYHIPAGLALVSQILFVHYYLGTGRVWLLWTFILSRIVVLIVNFSVYPSITFSSIGALDQISLFGDQVTTVAAAVPRAGWQQFTLASILLLLAYLTDAAVRRLRMADKESKRKGAAVILGLAVPMLGTIVYGRLYVLGILRVPVSNMPWFMSALLMMALELGRDFVVSRRALDRLAELQDQLARGERISTVGQLASALLHEVTQPLSANVLNAAAALRLANRTPPDMEQLRTILEDISSDAQRGTEVINRMRQFIGQHAVTMQPLQLDDLVKEVISMVRPKAASNQVTLSLFIPPDVPRVLGDRVHLSQVLLNLLMNAIQAVQSRPSNARQVVVEARTEHDDVQITVRDSGPGISEDCAEKLFTPFFTTKSHGMGMGLSLSRSIIEAHGGRLWIDRMDRQDGAVFCFTVHRASP